MFTPQEQEIIKYGKLNGKTKDEVAEAITRLRTGRPYTTETPTEATPNYASAVSDAARAGVQKVQAGISDVASADNPVEAVEGGVKAAAGVVETASAPLTPLFSPLGKLIGYVSEKLGNTPLFKDAFAPVEVVQPGGGVVYEMPNKEPIAAERVAEFVSNASTVAGAALGAKGVPAVTTRSAKLLSDASTALEGITATGAEGIKAAKTGGKVPAQLMQRVARIPKSKQQDFQRLAGESVGDYLVNRGIFGTPEKLVDQLYKRLEQSKGSVDDALDTLPGSYKTPAIGTALKQLLDREQRTSTAGAISKDLERVRELSRSFKGDGLNMKEINEVKRLYERNVRLEYVKENVPDKVQQATNIDSAIRTWQASQAEKLGFKNLRQLNKETQLAKQLLDDLGAEYAGQAGNNAISFTDWIVIAGGDPASAAMFLTKKAVTSKTLMSKTAETLSGETKVPLPKAEFGAPTLDNYLKFLERTGGVN